jgi:hypothetical protein
MWSNITCTQHITVRGFLHICTCTCTIYCGLWPPDNTSCIFLTWYQSTRFSSRTARRNSVQNPPSSSLPFLSCCFSVRWPPTLPLEPPRPVPICSRSRAVRPWSAPDPGAPVLRPRLKEPAPPWIRSAPSPAPASDRHWLDRPPPVDRSRTLDPVARDLLTPSPGTCCHSPGPPLPGFASSRARDSSSQPDSSSRAAYFCLTAGPGTPSPRFASSRRDLPAVVG